MEYSIKLMNPPSQNAFPNDTTGNTSANHLPCPLGAIFAPANALRVNAALELGISTKGWTSVSVWLRLGFKKRPRFRKC